MLCLHPDAAFISNYDVTPWARPLRAPAQFLTGRSLSSRRRAWFSRGGQAYMTSRPLGARIVPTPVEGEAVYRRCGLTTEEMDRPLEAPARKALRRALAAVQSRHGAEVLLLKRTANNRRIPALDSALPEARYLVLWRDGRAVVNSLLEVHWWLDHRVWWAGNATPREMNLDRRDMVALAATNWREEVKAIERGLARIDAARVRSLRYEDLVTQPEAVLRAALDFLGMAATPEYLETALSTVSGSVQEKWRSAFSPDELDTIHRIIGAPLRRLSYV